MHDAVISIAASCTQWPVTLIWRKRYVMATIINCTPHAISFVDDAGKVIRVVEPSGILPRVSSAVTVVGDIDGIPDEVTTYGQVVGLPEKREGVIMVVSAMVAARLPDRDDIRIPGRQVRDDQGRIIGCKSLSNPNGGVR